MPSKIKIFINNIKREYLYTAAVVLLVVLAGVIYIVLTGKYKSNDLSKGLLIVNTNKAVYSPKEKVEISAVSLDQKGNTLCNSKLLLTVISPSGKKTELSTAKNSILVTTTCSPDNNVTNDPDYRADFTPSEEGNYSILLRNSDSKNKVENKFSVKGSEKFSINRRGASRLDPSKADRYPMTIIITPNADFKGQVIEQIPSSFNVIWNGPAKVETSGGNKTLTWEVDLRSGESKELVYEYASPRSGPHLYSLGSLKILKGGSTLYQEGRVWQLVNNITI